MADLMRAHGALSDALYTRLRGNIPNADQANPTSAKTLTIAIAVPCEVGFAAPVTSSSFVKAKPVTLAAVLRRLSEPVEPTSQRGPAGRRHVGRMHL